MFQFDRGLNFIPDHENYLLTIESVTNPKRCVHVGISDPSCPWNDDQRTVKNSKIWARILSLGYFSIKARKFPNSFVIILLPTESDQSCSDTANEVSNIEPKKMRMRITISPNSFRVPVIVSSICLAVPSLLSILGLFLFWRNKYKDHQNTKEEEEIEVPNTENHEHDLRINNLDEPDGDKICAECIGEEIKKKKVVFLPDLLIKYKSNEWHRKLRSTSYLYLIPLVALFYIIPSAQMVFLTGEYFNVSTSFLIDYSNTDVGSSEGCFFNYGCARPWWIFDSFNHIYR